MLQSMTGFGQVQKETEDLTVTVEIKALNAKNFDCNFRLPRQFSYKEPGLRTHLNNHVIRGKIFLSLDIQYTNVARLKRNINHELIESYHKEISQTAEKLNLSQEGLLNTLLNFPEVTDQGEETDQESQWEKLFPAIEEATEHLKQFRREEGANLYQQLKTYAQVIQNEKAVIEENKEARYQKVRDKLYEDLSKFFEQPDQHIDKNRFEQEVVYYMEKLDISEELDRLESHFHYFFQTLEEAEAGRRLNFIAQEIGREINTIGSKINDADIQQRVVTMKENLEKIKEQVQNIL